MKRELSIIIPAYNAEKYISDCLASIILQDGGAQHDVIVVDDGSRDDTPDIVNQWRAKYPNIRMIRQKNSGVSVARNTGIDAADGEYITFVDADDMVGLDYSSIMKYLSPIGFSTPFGGLNNYYDQADCSNTYFRVAEMPYGGITIKFETEYFARMLGNALKFDADMLIGSCFTTDPGARTLQYYSHHHGPHEFPHGDERGLFGAMNQCAMLENANYVLYRREMLNRHNLRFVPGMQLNEDLLFAMQAALRANKIYTNSTSTYLYRRHNGSLSNIDNQYPSPDKIWPTQLYITAVILSDMRKMGYHTAYNLFQRKTTDMVKQYGGQTDGSSQMPICPGCQRISCVDCKRDAEIWAKHQENLIKFKPGYEK